MIDPRTWSRRTLVLLCLLAASAVPIVLSACESGSSESQCSDGEILVDGVCTPATS